MQVVGQYHYRIKKSPERHGRTVEPDDDTAPTALDLPMVESAAGRNAEVFRLCHEKLGLVPNVLRAYAFDIDKLNAFTGIYNDLMLGRLAG